MSGKDGAGLGIFDDDGFKNRLKRASTDRCRRLTWLGIFLIAVGLTVVTIRRLLEDSQSLSPSRFALQRARHSQSARHIRHSTKMQKQHMNTISNEEGFNHPIRRIKSPLRRPWTIHSVQTLRHEHLRRKLLVESALLRNSRGISIDEPEYGS